MKVISRNIHDLTRRDEIRVIPLGDIHLGARACDEEKLQHVIGRIAADKNTYWIGMGDYLDAIKRSDPRFVPGVLADWIDPHEVDVVEAQLNKFLELFKPIASKCLCMLAGNHETAIHKHYEQHVFSAITRGIKRAAELPPEHKLSLGYNGWLSLKLYRSEESKKGGATTYKFRLHHGYGGGRLAGAKALNMERFLWVNDCDIAVMGHTHEYGAPVTRIINSIAGKRLVERKRIGVWSGSFLKTHGKDFDTYAEVKGYFPTVGDVVEIKLRPGAVDFEHRIRVTVGI